MPCAFIVMDVSCTSALWHRGQIIAETLCPSLFTARDTCIRLRHDLHECYRHQCLSLKTVPPSWSPPALRIKNRRCSKGLQTLHTKLHSKIERGAQTMANEGVQLPRNQIVVAGHPRAAKLKLRGWQGVIQGATPTGVGTRKLMNESDLVSVEGEEHERHHIPESMRNHHRNKTSLPQVKKPPEKTADGRGHE